MIPLVFAAFLQKNKLFETTCFLQLEQLETDAELRYRIQKIIFFPSGV